MNATKVEWQHVGAEAAIYAEGTTLTRDELVNLYRDYITQCERAGCEPEGVQRFFGKAIAGHETAIGDE